jgi:hypothetical protein
MRIMEKIVSVVFPSISEFELIALFFILLPVTLIHREEFIRIFMMLFFGGSIVISIITVFVFILFPVYCLLRILQLAFTKRRLPLAERTIFTGYFFFVLAISSFVSSMELLSRPADLIDWLKTIVVFYFAFRSFIQLFIIFILDKAKIKHVLVTRFSNEQIERNEALLLMIVSTVVTFLTKSNSIATHISISYVYVMLILWLMGLGRNWLRTITAYTK